MQRRDRKPKKSSPLREVVRAYSSDDSFYSANSNPETSRSQSTDLQSGQGSSPRSSNPPSSGSSFLSSSSKERTFNVSDETRTKLDTLYQEFKAASTSAKTSSNVLDTVNRLKSQDYSPKARDGQFVNIEFHILQSIPRGKERERVGGLVRDAKVNFELAGHRLDR